MGGCAHRPPDAVAGTKLVRQRAVEELRLGTVFPGVVLSPVGAACVSAEDHDLIAAKGLAVVDCSWHRLDDVPFSALPFPFSPRSQVRSRRCVLSSILYWQDRTGYGYTEAALGPG